jgi:hypothetical protein
MSDRIETAVCETDRRGRVQLPTALRKVLGIDDEKPHLVRISVSVVKPQDAVSVVLNKKARGADIIASLIAQMQAIEDAQAEEKEES